MKALKLKIAGGTAALAAVLGGGAAVAATQLSPTEESDAIVADAAKQLGVSAAKLDAALKQALENRVDAALEAGTITAAQAAELKERIEAGDVPLVGVGSGPGHRGGHHGFVDFAAAATFLGITQAELRSSLEEGDTLGEIAKANGKTAAGLSDALVAAAKADLDAKVKAGRLTAAQRTSILADLESRIDDIVNGEFSFGFRGGHGPRPGMEPPADA
jgi:transposase-like protein